MLPLGGHDVVVNVQGDLIQVDNNRTHGTGPGIKALLDASYPEATYDDSPHPTSCCLGTRLQFIEDITGWALALALERDFNIMWMEGPAGVGKSSLAQTCVEKVDEKLAAAFFFSRSDSRDDSTRLFPSIAYQLVTKYPLYRNKLEDKMRLNQTLVHKSVAVQFRELIVVPLQELQEEGQGVGEGVTFIDGLDGCAGEDAQCTIIDTISVSVRDRTTPFIWAVFSRPKPHIVAQFSAPHINDLCWRLTLPVSHGADGDIESYLQDGPRKIRVKYDIPLTTSWAIER